MKPPVSLVKKCKTAFLPGSSAITALASIHPYTHSFYMDPRSSNRNPGGAGRCMPGGFGQIKMIIYFKILQLRAAPVKGPALSYLYSRLTELCAG